MAEESIDRIQVEISGDASAAVRNLNNLVTALGNLENKVGSSATKLLQLSNALSSLKRSVTGFDLTGLKQLKEVKFSKTVPNNLSLLAMTLQGMPADSVSKLTGIAMGLRSMSAVSIPKGTVTQIAELPAVFREFQSLNVTEFANQLRQLNSQLGPFAANVSKLGAAWSKLPPSLRSVAAAARTVASSNRYLQTTNTALIASNARVVNSFQSIAASAKSAIGRIAGLSATYQLFKRAFEATIGNVNTYIENMNLFQASMGKYTQSASEYGQKIQDVLGIDFADWARNQGVFQTLITGMGDTADRAAVMSQQLTQLGYDIASFYNISVDDAMLKLQSGMAGELEPLRRLGWDLSNARMQLEATKLGIEGNVQEMTQAEKVALRYHLIMTQVTQTHGDMARTIASPANQLRVLQAQLSLAARAIGNLFIPALNMILPVVIAVVKAIRLLAQTIANFFGIDANFEVDYSTLDTSGIATGGDAVDDLTDSLDDSGTAADKAKKKIQQYKNTVMGFDELNKLNPEPEDTSDDSSGSGSGAGVGGGGAGGIDLPLETYDFLAGLNDHISQMTDELAQKILKLLPYIGAVAAGLAAWKIASALGAGLKTCAGLAMAVAGAVILVWNWLDAWNNGITFENLTGMLIGIGLLVGGLALAFGSVGAAIGLIVGGAALLTAGFKDAWENGLTLENLIAVGIGGALLALGLFLTPLGAVGAAIGVIIGGIALLVLGFKDLMENGFSETNLAAITAGFVAIGAAIGFLIGGPMGLLIGAVVGLVAAIVTVIVSNWDWLCENIFTPIGEWIDTNVIQPVIGFFTGLGEFFSGLWTSITETFWAVWGAIAGWVDENVVQPIMAIWEPIAQWFSDLWGSVSATAEALFHNIGVFADGCWQIVVRVWEVVSEWFDKNVIQPVSTFFTNLWNGVSTAAQNAWNTISGAWSVVTGWFDRNIIQPISNAFSTAWNSIADWAGQAWQGIQNIFSNVASFFGGIFSNAWQQIISVFQYGGQIFNGVVDAIVNAFKYVVNQLIGGLNWAIAQPFNGLNSILSAMRGWEILDIHPFAGFWDVPVPQIPYLAEGRYGIDSGQLFVARESGAEMVGSMNGHTTVANNQQIVEGIEAGVTRAMLQALAVAGGDRGGEATIEIPLRIGAEEIARAVWKGNASLVRRGEITATFA